MERGNLKLENGVDHETIAPETRDAAREEAGRLAEIYKVALKPFSERLHLPATLRGMVKDLMRARSATPETANACVMAIVTRLDGLSQLAFWQSVAYEASKFAIAAMQCPVAAWEDETDAVSKADPVQARAIVALQTGNTECESIDLSARLSHDQAFRSFALSQALRSSRKRTNGRVLTFTGAHA